MGLEKMVIDLDMKEAARAVSIIFPCCCCCCLHGWGCSELGLMLVGLTAGHHPREFMMCNGVSLLAASSWLCAAMSRLLCIT
jgi:hypothetical protein